MADICKRVIGNINSNLLRYAEPVEEESAVLTGPFGWANLFKEAISDLNPNLLEYTPDDDEFD